MRGEEEGMIGKGGGEGEKGGGEGFEKVGIEGEL